MKSKCILLFLLLAQFANGQHHFGLKLGMNYPITYDYKTLRKVSGEVGFLYNKSIAGTFGFETGLNIAAYQRNNVVIKQRIPVPYLPYYMVDEKTIWARRVDVDIPLLLTFTSKNFEFKAGGIIYVRSAFTGGTYSGYIGHDPEVNVGDPTYDDTYGPRDIDFGMDICISRNIKGRWRGYMDFKSPLKSESYGLIGCGLVYRLGKMQPEK